MRISKLAAVLAAAIALPLGMGGQAADAAAGSAGPAVAPPPSVVAAGPLTDCSADFYTGDFRLGPAQLPLLGLVGLELLGYHRSGDLTGAQLLARYYNASAGSWIYPPDNGYVIVGGQPVEYQATLLPGQDIDRYGSEYGSFLAPEGLSYAARSIPPQSLDSTPAAGCNYHDYRVLKPFAVDAGPIAPWFGQPGYGLQYQLDASLIPGGPAQLNVMWLVNNGYLARLN
jgi:Tuberculosis necrotizing toxin